MTATLAELFDQSATLAKLLAKLFDQYEQVIYADFEFIAKPGEPPDVVCLAWREEPSGRTYQLWRDQLGATPPYRTDNRALFICFVGNAELHCHLALGWPLPANVLDLSAEFRCISRSCTVPAGRARWAYYRLQRHRLQAQGSDAEADHARLAIYGRRARSNSALLCQ